MNDRTSLDDAELLRLYQGGPAFQAQLAALAATDPTIPDRLALWDKQDAALRALYGHVADEPVPERQRAVLLKARTRGHRHAMMFARAAAMFALVAFGVAGGWTASRLGMPDSSLGELASEAYRAHSTYAVEVLHPVEVLAADRTHLATWLSKRIGQPIKLPELSDHGYRLLGGRVVPSVSGAAAQLMYENDAGQRISLYIVRETSKAETAFRYMETGGTGEFWWFDDDLGCAVVGDLPQDTLRAISVAAYTQLSAT